MTIPRSRFGAFRGASPVVLSILFGVFVAPVAGLAGDCDATLQASKTEFGPGGGTATVKVLTQDGCTWQVSAMPSGSWIHLTGPSSGRGPGSFGFTVEVSREEPDRYDEIFVGGGDWFEDVEVRQIGLWGGSKLLPVAAALPGENDTHWRTDLCLFNPNATGGAAARVSLLFHPASYDPVDPVELTSLPLEIPPHATLCEHDVLGQLEPTKGALLVVMDNVEELENPIILVSRTFTSRPEDGGTFGQNVPSNSLPPFGQRLFIAGLQHYRNADGSGYRTAIGLANRTEYPIARIVVHLIGSMGWEAGRYETGLWGNGYQQINRIVEKVLGPGAELRNFSVIIDVPSFGGPGAGAGALSAYASVVDEQTGDAVFIPARGDAPSGHESLVPAAASVPGEHGTHWRTDLCVFNRNPDRDAGFHVWLHPASGEEVPPIEVVPGGAVLPPHGTRCWNDLLAGLGPVKGAISVLNDHHGTLAPVLVTSRTYTVDPGGGGSWGQEVPGEDVPPPAERHLVLAGLHQYQHTDGSGYRTAIGLFNTFDVFVDRIVLHLLDSGGQEVGSYETSLPANGFLQIDRIVEKVLGSGAELKDFSVIIDTGRAGGLDYAVPKLLAYASVVDEQTGDAVFITATPNPALW